MRLCYRVTLESPLGPRPGFLRLEFLDSRIDGTLSLLGFDNAVSGRRLDEHRLILTHSLRTAVSVLPCESTLEWNGSVLTGTTRTAGGQLSWRGELLETSEKGD